MNSTDLTLIAIYDNLIQVLKERGYSEFETEEIFIQLTARAEMEVVEEIIQNMTRDQLLLLDEIPESSSADQIAQKLGLEANTVDQIRAKRTVLLVQEIITAVDQPL